MAPEIKLSNGTLRSKWSILVVPNNLQGSLYDVYTTPKSYANIETLNEMDGSGIKIHVVHHGLIVDVFGEEAPGSDLGNLRQKLVPVPMQDALMEKIAKYGDAAALERALSMVKITNQYVRNDGISYLHTVKECPRCV